jgi:carbon-monoxide dehydrogenase medium subunit
MRDFDYARPTTLAEMLGLLARHNGSSRLIAGGTDLIDQIRTGRHQPDWVIDAKAVPELNVLEASADGLRLGAAVPCWRVYGDEAVGRDYSALADSCRIIGGMQIQNRATVGGNLCNAGPAADSIPALIALGAVCVIDGPQGERSVPVHEFCTGPGRNVLAPGEVLVELDLPPRPPHSGSHYRRFIPRNEMDIAVVGVGASVTLDESGRQFVSARVALGAVAPTPLLVPAAAAAVIGSNGSDEALEAAAAAAREAARPIDDMRGTAKQRRHLAGVLAKRALRGALARARGETNTNGRH